MSQDDNQDNVTNLNPAACDRLLRRQRFERTGFEKSYRGRQ